MKLIKAKKTGLTVLKEGVKRTPATLWSTGKTTARHLNTLNPKEDIEQEEKNRKRKNGGIAPRQFMTSSELKKWDRLPERKKEQLLRMERIIEQEKTGSFRTTANTSIYGNRSQTRRTNDYKNQIPTQRSDYVLAETKSHTLHGGIRMDSAPSENYRNPLREGSEGSKETKSHTRTRNEAAEIDERLGRAGQEKKRLVTATKKGDGIKRINKVETGTSSPVMVSTKSYATASARSSSTSSVRASSGTASPTMATRTTATTTARTTATTVATTTGKVTASAGKTAAAVGETAVTVGKTAVEATATGGVAVAAEAGKKAAKKITRKLKEMVQTEELLKEERIRQTAVDQKRKEELASDSHSTDGVQYNSASQGVKAAHVVTTIVAVVTSFLSAVMAILISCMMIASAIIIFLAVIIAFISKTGGTGSQKLVETAIKEYEMSDQNIGGVKYKNWYGLDDDWCGMFVSYCADKSGYITQGVMPKSASVSENVSWYKARGEYETKESGYIPSPGDIIFFTNGMSHMGIVIEYDEDADHVVVIDGNSGSSETDPYHKGSHVCKHTYARTMSGISGYGRPAYPDQVSDLIGGSNAEKIFNALVEQGYTPQAAAAVVGNLYREAGIDASGDIQIHAVNPDGSSIGIAQWTGGRKEGFLTYAESCGEPWDDDMGTSLGVQLNYLLMELSSNQWIWTGIGSEYGDACNISLSNFKTLTDTEYATRVFCAMFERCHLENAALPYRTRKAMDVYNAYAGE